MDTYFEAITLSRKVIVAFLSSSSIPEMTWSSVLLFHLHNASKDPLKNNNRSHLKLTLLRPAESVNESNRSSITSPDNIYRADWRYGGGKVSPLDSRLIILPLGKSLNNDFGTPREFTS